MSRLRGRARLGNKGRGWFEYNSSIVLCLYKTMYFESDFIYFVFFFFSSTTQMLTSPVVSACVYSNQIETLLSHFVQSYGPDGQLSLDTFAPLARALLLMVYQNTYPGDVRQVFD